MYKTATQKFVRLLALLLAMTFFLIGSNSTGGAEKGKQFLGDKHTAKGLECSGCHKENPPEKPVPTEACLQCHGGTYAKLADMTKANPNPHLSHLGDIPCSACHHSHKESELKCDSCHDFELNVP